MRVPRGLNGTIGTSPEIRKNCPADSFGAVASPASLRTIALGGAIQRANIVRPQLRGLLILAADGFVHFPPVDRDVLRGFDAELYLVATHIDDCYDHIVADD